MCNWSKKRNEKGTKGIAAADAAYGEDGSPQKAVLGVGMHGLYAASGHQAAASGEKGRNLGGWWCNSSYLYFLVDISGDK
jgi:hypothetical protein